MSQILDSYDETDAITDVSPVAMYRKISPYVLIGWQDVPLQLEPTRTHNLNNTPNCVRKTENGPLSPYFMPPSSKKKNFIKFGIFLTTQYI
jgi:hypothetical protein